MRFLSILIYITSHVHLKPTPEYQQFLIYQEFLSIYFYAFSEFL